MPWTISHDSEKHLIRAASSGEMTAERVTAMIGELIAVGKALAYKRYLVDHRQADIRISVLDTYNRPAEVGRLDLPPGWRVAILHAEKDAETFRFYQNVSLNRGLPVHVFTDESAALAWLIDDPTT